VSVASVVVEVIQTTPVPTAAVADGQYEPLTTQVHAIVAAVAADGTMVYPWQFVLVQTAVAANAVAPYAQLVGKATEVDAVEKQNETN